MFVLETRKRRETCEGYTVVLITTTATTVALLLLLLPRTNIKALKQELPLAAISQASSTSTHLKLTPHLLLLLPVII